jgi:hypothetical protein
VLAGVTSTEWSVWISYPWYNWGYWGDYSGYSYYYPPYPPGWGGSYTFTTGSLLVIMEDRNAAEGEIIPVLWAAGMNGLLEGSTSSINNRIIDGIEQAFSQSPYLEED